MTLIEARAVGVRRAGRTVLDGIDLDIARGEIVGVIGPNGAGKSTLARVLLGLERPSSGTIARAERLSVGYVPQAMRRDENLPLSAQAFLALTPRQFAPGAEELIERLGLAGVLDRPLAGLSGGELRRAALARALLPAPDLLVLDEPLAGIDAVSQEPIYALIAARGRESRAGTLLIAHEVLTVLRLADRVLCLNTQACPAEPPGRLIERADFLRLFGRDMADLAKRQMARAPGVEAQCAHG